MFSLIKFYVLYVFIYSLFLFNFILIKYNIIIYFLRLHLHSDLLWLYNIYYIHTCAYVKKDETKLTTWIVLAILEIKIMSFRDFWWYQYYPLHFSRKCHLILFVLLGLGETFTHNNSLPITRSSGEFHCDLI